MSMTSDISDPQLADRDAFVAEAAALFPGGGIGPSDAALRSLNPTMLRSGQGAWLHASDGRKFLDFVMGGSALILGHRDPHVMAAMTDQLQRGTHFYQILHEPALAFARKLVDTIPMAEKLIFTSTGSDAVNQSLRLARAATGKAGVLKFTGAYHGSNDVALVGMSSPQGRNGGQADAAGIDPRSTDNVFAVGRGDLTRVETILRLEGDRIACILIDPLQRWLRPDADFLSGLRALCDQYGVLLVFDEVVTGYRMALGGAQAHWGVRPDIAAYGKIIGGGLPLGAVAGSAAIMDMANSRRPDGGLAVPTSGTFNANALACAAGLATLERVCVPGFYTTLAETGAALRADMQAIMDRHGIGGVVGGAASFWHVSFGDHEPTTYEDNLGLDLERARALDRALLNRGIFVMPNGRRSLSTAHGPAEIAHFLSVFDDICKQKAF